MSLVGRPLRRTSNMGVRDFRGMVPPFCRTRAVSGHDDAASRRGNPRKEAHYVRLFAESENPYYIKIISHGRGRGTGIKPSPPKFPRKFKSWARSEIWFNPAVRVPLYAAIATAGPTYGH